MALPARSHVPSAHYRRRPRTSPVCRRRGTPRRSSSSLATTSTSCSTVGAPMAAHRRRLLIARAPCSRSSGSAPFPSSASRPSSMTPAWRTSWRRAAETGRVGQLAIDHVVIPMGDLASAASVLESKYGLMSVEGGRHPGWGTANRIVPLGDAYLELVAVAAAAAAAARAFGAWVAAGLASGGGPLGWAVRTDRIDDVARRLGLTVADGS